MKAIGVVEYGGPEALRIVELPEPHPGKGEVRIRVHAVTVNPTDILIRNGSQAERLKHLPPPYVPGMDAAGIIDEVGPGNDGRLKVGDKVIAVVTPLSPHKGAYAEQIIVPAASVVLAPSKASFAEASTLLMNALTIRLALDALALQPGRTVAITGSAGAVGGFAIELAKADGLRVVADAADKDRELVKSLGADLVVERGDAVAKNIRAAVPEGVHGLIDAALQHEKTVPAIADGGGLVTLRGWTQPLERGLSVHPVMVGTALTDTARLERLRDQAEAGALTLRVAKVFPASQAAEAHRLLEAGGVRGRPVIDFMDFSPR
ncbi:NADP-dependent oxidoreductase [Stigmatella aurantiaca]|nr:NADP-dependent oxidoreductase [Stigmatella aurantiaca]